MKKFSHDDGAFFSSGDADIYYEIISNQGKPTMLFLHGGAGNIEDFNSILHIFADEYQLMGIDSRGHGKSGIGTFKLTYEQLQRDAESILDVLGIREVSIVGFSDGAIVGYRLAAAKVIKVNKLISIGGTWSNDDVKATADMLKGFTVDRWRKGMPESFAAYQRLTPEKDPDTSLRRIIDMWLDESEAGYPNEDVKHIEAKTLIVRGDKDHLFPRQSAVKLADLIDDSVFLNIPFVGHVAFNDNHGIFEKVVKEFLKSS